jgi:nitroreductase
MDTFEAILSRRSIRQYTNEVISHEIIDKLLTAAMQAPSARDTQSWHFIVIEDKNILKDISQVHPYADMLRHAPLAIAVCGDFHLEESAEYLALNCAAATMNILLAAHSFGLGAVWLGIHPRRKRIKDLREVLNLPENIIPITLIAIGHPKESKDKIDRFDPNKIRYNQWQ